uniref:Germin-like protein n=2 Tax=Physcomitrium patens TaxID=3218 RepID=A0A7I3Z314_PHYPA
MISSIYILITSQPNIHRQQLLHCPSILLHFLSVVSSAPTCTLSTMNSMWITLSVLVMVGLVPSLTMAADEDPLQDFCVADTASSTTINGLPCKPAAQVVVGDFKSVLLKNPGTTYNYNAVNVTAANVFNFQGLNTFGISAVRIDFGVGGINPPHVHPRATEILYVLQGSLYVGFVSTSNTLFATILVKGDLFVFPRGLVHFQLNVGTGIAAAFAALSSQNPGVQQIAPALFGTDIDDRVLQKRFRINARTVNTIQAAFAP